MKYGFMILFASCIAIQTACIQVNLPESTPKKTVHYTLDLPRDFKSPSVQIAVAEFASESPAKFKMLLRKGTELQQDSFAKWSQSPSVMISAALRDLFGCDDADYEKSPFLLEGDIYIFERNLDTNTADLKILYRLVNRKNGDTVFTKLLNSSVSLKGNSPADFAAAMSKAVVEQATVIRNEIEALNKKK